MVEVDDGKIARAMLVYAFGMLGVFLAVAPWTPLWGQAFAALRSTRFESLVEAGWLRGAVSGLGALDVLVSLQIAVEMWGGGGRRDPDPGA